MDYGILNNAVNNAFGENVSVQTSAGTFTIKGVFNLSNVDKPMGTQSVEMPDPNFEFNSSEFNKLGAGISDVIIRDGIIYTIVSVAPTYGDVVQVVVRAY